MRIGVVKRAEELILRVLVAGRTVAADADAHRARAATLPLRLPDRMEDAFAHAVQVASGLAKVRNFHRQRVLSVLCLAAGALWQRFELYLVCFLPVLESLC